MEALLSKKEYALRLLGQRQAALRCPICAGAVTADGAGLLCAHGHRFDVNKKGGLCLLKDYGAGYASEYDARLFESRRWVFARGCFDPLIELLAQHMPPDALTVDLGCGEGSLAVKLAQACPEAHLLGVDISPDGIKAAERISRPNTLFFRGDLAALPLADESADLLINILSPARYGEFARVLKPGALLIKAAPTPRHLQQLRGALQRPYQKEEDVAERFAQSFCLLQHRVLEYDVPLENADAARHILNMTPLGLDWRDDTVFLDKSITFSLNIYIGTRQEK